HGITGAVKKLHEDTALGLEKVAQRAKETDARAKSAFDDLERRPRGDVHAGPRAGAVAVRWADHPARRGLSHKSPSPALAKERSGTLETGARRGLDATPETIRHRTVRMEEHPDFENAKSELKAAGYPLK